MKIDRLLSMVILFINRKKLTAKQLSEHFGVTVKTIRRDIDTLTIAGIPIYSEVGQAGGYFIHEGFTLNRSVFTEAEYDLIRDMLGGLDKSLANNLTSSVFNKIIQNVDSHSDKETKMIIDLMPWDDKKHMNEVLTLIKAGIEACQYVSFKYYKPGSMAHLRKVKPIRIVLKGGGWYLKAFCTFSDAHRTFKFTRMAEVKLIDETFEPVKDDMGDQDYFTNWYGVDESNPINIRFFQPIYGQLDQLIPLDKIEWDAPYFDYALPFRIDEWLLKTIFGFREHVMILDEDFKQVYLDNLMKIVNLYN